MSNFELFTLKLIKKGKKNKITIENAKQKTPPVLLGIERNIA
jgi:hypothetical protein